MNGNRHAPTKQGQANIGHLRRDPARCPRLKCVPVANYGRRQIVVGRAAPVRREEQREPFYHLHPNAATRLAVNVHAIARERSVDRTRPDRKDATRRAKSRPANMQPVRYYMVTDQPHRGSKRPACSRYSTGESSQREVERKQSPAFKMKSVRFQNRSGKTFSDFKMKAVRFHNEISQAVFRKSSDFILKLPYTSLPEACTKWRRA